MDFTSVIWFLIMYYLRPQEWIGFLSSLRPVQLIIICALVSMVMRNRGLKLKDFFETPHDWAIYIFLAWLVFSGPAPKDAWDDMNNRLIFYLVVLQALSSWERIEKFLWWWVILLFMVASLAVASEYGFDPTHSYDLTHGWYKGRLMLNMSIFNNPNSLGNSVVILIPMVYFLCLWKRPFVIKEIALVLFTVPTWCLFLTQSKGSYVSGAATFAGAMMFGRSKIAQILLALVFFTAGGEVLRSMPRMGTLQKADMKAEGGILGRVTAYRFGWKSMQTLEKGLGHNRFQDAIFRDTKWPIASHGSYNQVGAELGKTGLFLYLAILYCCFRTLITARCTTDQEERVRRVLFAALLGFTVSSWMVDFAYRGVFFFQAAAIAAFHRLLIKSAKEAKEKEALAPAPAVAGLGTIPPPPPVPPEPVSRILGNWNRIGVLDVGLMFVMYTVWIRIWSYIVFKV